MILIVHRLVLLLWATATVLALGVSAAPAAGAEPAPWFVGGVGDAIQVVSVVRTGPTDAELQSYERTDSGWQPVADAVRAKIGEKGMSPEHYDGSMMTPTGAFTLDYSFGTEPNPGGALRYVQTDANHWWDGDQRSPTYNTMQVCAPAECRFSTAAADGTENLDIPQYAHAVVMGVNSERIPGKGGAFFVHTTDGQPTAGCVAIADDAMVQLITWLRPGAVIAIGEAGATT
ncbi:L,D-transpeptidase family protein [Skermania piniformis]|uniref:L,D-transpeptidase family protein n=1 Tax=Skermania pinensis TaxID=39122 RepID=A0ABX8S7Y8_9ACTN|nr:L,D-transpeptidase family protein [Skermania piniformis]QXQ13873.1 L,D-transpeptidase family protein [Skermania piniformis]